MGRAIEPYVPHEERIDNLGETAQVAVEVENVVVVEGDSHADIVERRGVALQVLDGIGVGVEDVWAVDNLLRGGRGLLDKIVVVGIDAGNHITAHAVGHEPHERRLLATVELAGARGEHHLEVVAVGLEAREDSAPEEHVVVAFDIGHDAVTRLPGVEPVGSRQVVGGDAVFESSTHC